MACWLGQTPPTGQHHWPRSQGRTGWPHRCCFPWGRTRETERNRQTDRQRQGREQREEDKGKDKEPETDRSREGEERDIGTERAGRAQDSGMGVATGGPWQLARGLLRGPHPRPLPEPSGNQGANVCGASCSPVTEGLLLPFPRETKVGNTHSPSTLARRRLRSPAKPHNPPRATRAPTLRLHGKAASSAQGQKVRAGSCWGRAGLRHCDCGKGTQGHGHC